MGYDLRVELERVLAEALKEENTILAAWLFGSQARGTATARSDVDLAVLLDCPPATLDEMPWDLARRLTGLVGRPVQVVVVNRAPADLVRRVLRDGKLLVERDASARVRFEVRKRNEYFDMTPIWRLVRRLPPDMAP